MPKERSPELPGNRELLESLLKVEGSLGSTYRRFHNYSSRNLGYLALQGCPVEPVATYKRWIELGRQVQRGQKAFSILRPIQVKVDREDQVSVEPKFIRRFKTVRALFAYSQTEGDELPPYEPPEWSRERALGSLGITLAKFEMYDGNTQGYSYGKTVTVSPVAAYPLKTLLHELSHVVAGHTTDAAPVEDAHKGLHEFEAEGSAHLAMMSLDATDQFDASESRAYIQRWLNGTTPPEQSIGRVLTTSSKIVEAGYEKSQD